VITMTGREEKGRESAAQPRAPMTFPPELHETSDLAKENKVSIARLERDVVEKYVAGKWPLITRNEKAGSHD